MEKVKNRHPLQNPSNKVAFEGVCFAVSKSVGKIPLFGDAVNYACSRPLAEARYMELYPLFKSSVNSLGREHEVTKHFLEEMAMTANVGARRNNFRNRYIKNPQDWKKLPPSPKGIPYGFW